MLRKAWVLVLVACGAPDAPVSHPPAVLPPPPPTVKMGVRHAVATQLAAAIEAKDAMAAAATFGRDGTLHRWKGEDVRGPEVERVFRQALGLCTMRVASILERATSFVMQLESTCTHPKMSGPQSHLIVADVKDETIAFASIWTMLFGPKDTGDPIRREIEDPSTLSKSREQAATQTIDTEKTLLEEFRNHERTVWATSSCTVLTVVSPTAHGYVEIECLKDKRRYLDWNGWRLLPFADEVYVEKR